jgi:imidazolonepropionase-like amidohydrolase
MPERPAWKFKQVRSVPEPRTPEHIVIYGRVFTGGTAGVIEDGFVRIDGTKIAAVGSRAELGSGAEGAVEVGGPDMTVLPGMFNNHAHLGWDGANELAMQGLEDEPEISAYKCAANMLRSLSAGVTTVRDLGMNTSNLFAKQAREQGVFKATKLLVCGEAIVQTGGHTYWCCREASGADEMRRAVREQVRAGADLIKIMASHDRLEFTDEELDAVIDETHRNGLPITAHATWDECINRVAAHGVDTVEHGGSMSDETVELLLSKGIYITTTFAPVHMQAEVGEEWGLPSWQIEHRKRQRADKENYAGLVKAARAGVPITFGTDAGSIAVPHNVVAPELKFMVEIGVCPDNKDALLSITSRSAAMNRLQDDRGALREGLAADVVVVDGNPVADLDDLENVRSVFVDGRQMVGAWALPGAERPW